MHEIKKKIIASVKDGNFLEVVYQAYFDIKNNSDDTLGLILSGLHNERQINLPEEFLKLKRVDSKRDFFTLRHAFSNALPFLDAPILDVMKCVKHLTIQAEGDMTQGLLIGPFIEYCKTTPSKINEALSVSLENIDEDFDFISPTLIAGSEIDLNHYFEIAIKLLVSTQTHPELIKRAIFSLGRMRYKVKNQSKTAFLTILQKVPEVDSQSFAVCLKALFNIYIQNQSLEKQFLDFISCNQERFDDLAIHNTSDLLYLNDAPLPEVIENKLLEIISKVNPENKGTIDQIDWVLTNLFKRGRAESAIECLERISVHCERKISIQQFDSVSRKLIENTDQILSKTITKWFLSRNITLYWQASELIQNPYFDKSIEIDCDLTQIKNSNQSIHLFLTRKAIGWFFMRPISAISFVISIIETCSESELSEIEKACFQPLLISYPGSVRKYLEDKVKNSNKRMKRFCNNLLSRLKIYHADLKSAQDIKELKPSEQDRYIYNRHHQRLMNESMKSAKSSSLMSVLGVQESVLLYGNKSISYIHTSRDKKVRQEIPLHKFSTSFEYPSLEFLDPHNLDLSLRIFRIEGCES